MHRSIERTVESRPATDGAGVRINRLSGFTESASMDPFLMLDEIRSDSKSDFIGGFPPHPHRGFETVTYMREGGFSHTDSMGNTGNITTGGAQWMTAGSGVIHSEMPVAEADRMHGFQFWLNLPAAEKMQPPGYRDIQGGEVVTLASGQATIRLIAGSLGIDGREVAGTVTGKTTRPLIADINLPAENALTLGISPDLNVHFYVYEGTVAVDHRQVKAGTMAYVGPGSKLGLTTENGGGLLLFGGAPINEPVAHHGPFVMNTPAEIEQAIEDYRDGTLAGSA